MSRLAGKVAVVTGGGSGIGRGIVLDFSRHLGRVLSIDPEARTAVVEPGTVHAVLQKAATPHGVRFGPDPSTHPRCTIGGMIGNNACGSRALGYGRTSDNVLGLSTLTADGTGVETRAADLAALVDQHLGLVRTEFGRFGRQVSGYSLEHLLPERRFDVARFFAGTEGTLGVIVRATVRLVADAPERVMVALGYETMAHAGDDIYNLLQFNPTACEGLDRRIVDVVRERNGTDAVGVDWRIPLDEASRRLGGSTPVQGNIDPAMLQAPWAVLEAHVRDVVERGRAAPAHVLNLGHGVSPDTDPDVLTRIVELAHTL